MTLLEKKKIKNDNIWGMSIDIKNTNTGITGVSRKESRSRDSQKVFEKIMLKTFSKMNKKPESGTRR